MPPELLTVAEGLVLARARWQIEMVWKLWKSQGQVDSWRSTKGGAILCELYAKVIAMVLHHWVMVVSCWSYEDRSLVKATASIRLHVITLALAIGDSERLEGVLALVAKCLERGCRINKRKTSPHTFQLLLQAPDLVLA